MYVFNDNEKKYIPVNLPPWCNTLSGTIKYLQEGEIPIDGYFYLHPLARKYISRKYFDGHEIQSVAIINPGYISFIQKNPHKKISINELSSEKHFELLASGKGLDIAGVVQNVVQT